LGREGEGCWPGEVTVVARTVSDWRQEDWRGWRRQDSLAWRDVNPVNMSIFLEAYSYYYMVYVDELHRVTIQENLPARCVCEIPPLFDTINTIAGF
jgi:hypothetical protein